MLPDLDRAVKDAEVGPPEQAELEAAYFDTADLRLLRRGVTVRFRRGEATGDLGTAKLPSEVRLGRRVTVDQIAELDHPPTSLPAPAQVESPHSG